MVLHNRFMKKQIKKIGNSRGITFSKEEQEVYDIKVNDVFDIEMTKEKKQWKNLSMVI